MSKQPEGLLHIQTCKHARLHAHSVSPCFPSSASERPRRGTQTNKHGVPRGKAASPLGPTHFLPHHRSDQVNIPDTQGRMHALWTGEAGIQKILKERRRNAQA